MTNKLRNEKLQAYNASFLSDSDFRSEIFRLARVMAGRVPYCARTAEEIGAALLERPSA